MAVATFPVPIFVGLPRSGTTLVRSIFNAHPDLAVAYEPNILPWVIRNRARYTTAGRFDTAAFLADLLGASTGSFRLETLALEPETLRNSVAAATPLDLAGAVRAVYGAYAAAQEKPRYGDKTPVYVRHIAPIAELLPEARFVHVVRDGRDVALATSEVDFGAVNLTQTARRWAQGVRRAQEAGRALGPSRYVVVRYEDITDDPEREVTRLCGFLSLDFDEGMLRYFERSEEVFSGMPDTDHHQRQLLPVTSGLRNWREQMPAGDVQRFESIAGPVLADLGYEVRLSAKTRIGLQRRLRTMFELVHGEVAVAVRRTVRRRSRRKARSR